MADKAEFVRCGFFFLNKSFVLLPVYKLKTTIVEISQLPYKGSGFFDNSFIITGMKENNNNIISASSKDKDESSVSNGAVKSAVEEYISTHSNQDGMGENDLSDEDDHSQIIRQPGLVTDQLIE